MSKVTAPFSLTAVRSHQPPRLPGERAACRAWPLAGAPSCSWLKTLFCTAGCWEQAWGEGAGQENEEGAGPGPGGSQPGAWCSLPTSLLAGVLRASLGHCIQVPTGLAEGAATAGAECSGVQTAVLSHPSGLAPDAEPLLWAGPLFPGAHSAPAPLSASIWRPQRQPPPDLRPSSQVTKQGCAFALLLPWHLPPLCGPKSPWGPASLEESACLPGSSWQKG